MNAENNKTNEPHKFVLRLSQRLDLRSSNKHVIRQQHKNNKFKIMAQTWNVKFEFLGSSYSVSNIQDYIKYIKKSTKHYPLILLSIFRSIGFIIDYCLK